MELIDILDERGVRTGEAKPIDEVHTHGLWHRTAHMWLVNSNNEVLLQHRSNTMQVSPNMWGMSSGGHVSAGEDPEIAARRELQEEIGADISLANFKLVGRAIYQDTHPLGSDNEFQNIYLIKGDFNLEDFKVDEVEVQGLKFISIPEFLKWTEDKKSDLVIHGEEYNKMLFQALQNLEIL